MGLFDFFRRSAGPPAPMDTDAPMLTALAGAGAFSLSVVGESFHRENLDRVRGPQADGVRDLPVIAVLVCESDNPHDPEAVRVDVNGRAVGHLTRAKARAYRARLADLGLDQRPWACRAMIRGGGNRGADDRGDYGIRLDLDLRKCRGKG